MRHSASVVSGLFVPTHGLCVVQWHALAVVVGAAQARLRVGLPLVSGLSPPADRRCLVLWHALALVVGVAEPELRRGMPLVSTFPEPTHRRCVVAWHPLAEMVGVAQREQRGGEFLVGSLPVPAHRLGVILWHALTAVIGNAEEHLRHGVSRLSRLSQISYVLRLVDGQALAGVAGRFGLDSGCGSAVLLSSLHVWRRTSGNHEGRKQQDERALHVEILQPSRILHKRRTPWTGSRNQTSGEVLTTAISSIGQFSSNPTHIQAKASRRSRGICVR